MNFILLLFMLLIKSFYIPFYLYIILNIQG
nr:MAG TPA: hypothetical protein [Caudoviricetes sp.]